MRYPAYGKKLMDLRKSGKEPENCVVVAFDWNTGKFFPHIAVVDEDCKPETLELRFLAGLDVIIAYHEKQASRVLDMARAILKVNPRTASMAA